MHSVRLPAELEIELESLSEQKNVSRPNIIKEALVEYNTKEKNTISPMKPASNISASGAVVRAIGQLLINPE